MKIIYLGDDTHKNSNMVCSYDPETQKVTHNARLSGEAKDVLKYIENAQKYYDEPVRFVVGYEAGCMGFTLKRLLNDEGIECHVMAPSTIAAAPGDGKKKTDRRDAERIAKSLAYGTYSEVHMPTTKDEGVRDYLRMRDDHKQMLGDVKRRILALCLRHGKHFSGTKTYWTKKHMEWLEHLELGGVDAEALDEYLITYNQLCEKVERLDRRIEEIAQDDDYREKVEKLCCLRGVSTHTALSFLVEVGDFRRFENAATFAAYLGLVPGEHSSGESQRKTGITKAGNTHLRKLLTESANAIGNSRPGYKSVALKKRQEGQEPKVVDYADRGNLRLGRKFSRMVLGGKPRNVAKLAIARELACFIWGMMTDHLDARCIA